MAANPLLSMAFEPSLEALGDHYWDAVDAAHFPHTRLRFRNNDLLWQLGLDPARVSDAHFEAAYGRFEARQPLLALRYHGYQFGYYNPQLGDGRGFLYGQVRDRYGQLQDLGTKGSGQTPWSRGGDGRLTLKGGIREVIASEALQRLGVATSRTLSLIETGESLYRGDEPSPTRSSVMVRMAITHLRFGSCERLLHLQQPARLERLLWHLQRVYYPHLGAAEQPLVALYGELVKRVARLAAQWMVAGFVHGVLNTDNMSLVGESFDYGPFAFLDRWDPGFTAAYFDHSGLYAYGQQPGICHQNLKLLQAPLAMVLPLSPLEDALQHFAPAYEAAYRQGLLQRLGVLPRQGTTPATDGSSSANHGGLLADTAEDPQQETGRNLVLRTVQLLAAWDIGYGDFFDGLRDTVTTDPPQDREALVPWGTTQPPRPVWIAWRDDWWHHWQGLDGPGRRAALGALQRWNLPTTPTRPVIEKVWNAIDQADDWKPLQQLVASWRWTGSPQPDPGDETRNCGQGETRHGGTQQQADHHRPSQ